MKKVLLQTAIGYLCLSGILNIQASDVFPENIFVTLKDSGEIAQYGGQSVWKGDPVMLYNAITPDSQRLVVSSPKTGSIYVFDTSTHKRLAKIKVGKAPKGLKVSPDGKEAYVANEADATVSVVELLNYTTVATINVDKTPHNIRFSHDGKWAYVTLQGGAGLGVIDTHTRKYVKTIPTPGVPNPHNLDISKDGKTVYIRDLGNTVGVLDLSSGKIKKVITVGQGHAGIDITPDEKYIFTGAIADDVVTVIDAKNLNIIKKIKVGFGPHGVRSSKDGRWLYVAITAEDKFVVIDIKTFDVVQEYNLPSFPFWIAVNGNP